MKALDIRDIDGIEIGHATDAEHGTGCTVILCERGAVASCDVRGGGPATRETDLLRPENMVERIHAVILSGGSAFGLDAAGGVMEYLERRGVGFDVGVGVVPIVCGASLFDLAVGDASVRPDREMGLVACGRAGMPSSDDVLEGNVGAGTGCTVGKLLGMEHASKSGIGIAGVDLDGLQVAAIVAVNAAGNIIGEDGTVVAGAVDEKGKPMSVEQALLGAGRPFAALSDAEAIVNTTIGCVVTNADITKAQACKIASTSHDGLARAIAPVHTSNDGDTIFVMATGEVPALPDTVGLLATHVVEMAIRRAVETAKPAYGLPGLG